MATDAEVIKELEALVAEVPELLKLANKDSQILAFGSRYQVWYSRATKLVELLGPDRLDEFCSYYLIDPKRKSFSAATYVIQDYITGTDAPGSIYDRPQWDIHKLASIRVVNQSQILESLKSRIGTVLADVTGHLLAQIEDEELDVARKLLKVSVRGAGAVAGVVLEGHLQRVANNHKIPIAKKDPVISDLNDLLKAGGMYDVPTWRKIQHLADIRNLCDHKKGREPTQDEVTELIAGVNSIVKTVF
jgi:hypothetical protein